jgi:orotidine-5'-phosphate decarboxylase
MGYLYDDLAWRIIVDLRYEPGTMEVSIAYRFQNFSTNDNLYYAFLPRFQAIPKSLNNEYSTIEARLCREDGFEQLILAMREEVCGIDKGHYYLVPFPWPSSNGYIPPKASLEMKFSWIEMCRDSEVLAASKEKWRISHSMQMNELFLPVELTGGSSDRNKVLPPESIHWKVTLPENVVIEKISGFLLTPDYRMGRPHPVHLPGKAAFIEFDVNTNAAPPQPACFKPHTLNLDLDVSVPKEIPRVLCEEALARLKQYTFDVCVAVVDLRGSSAKAEEQRDLPDPSAYVSKFQGLARQAFPVALLNAEPLRLLMKKVPGDMVMLISPANRAPELFAAVLSFIDSLESAGFLCRAGFHIDKATDTGKIMYSVDDFGTDFLGPAINYAAKVGDNKKSDGILLTQTVVESLLPKFRERYNFLPIESIEKVPDGIYRLQRKEATSSVEVGRQFHFADELCDRILRLDTRVCVGLDPDLSLFPRSLLKKYNLINLEQQSKELFFEQAGNCIVEFNKIVIDIVVNHSAAVKPQSAYYERFGHHGIRALCETAKYAHEKGLLVILDAKRNDIGSTARKYACAYLGGEQGEESAAVPFDAITINAYLGSDGIIPFVEFCSKYGKGVFILVKTSNQSSSELQDLPLRDIESTLAQHVAQLVADWGADIRGQRGFSAIGAVVGATHPVDIKVLRRLMPDCYFLMPGYGAQGAKAEDVKDAFKNQGLGIIVNSSRGILYPYASDDPDFAKKIEEQVIKMQQDLNRVAN